MKISTRLKLVGLLCAASIALVGVELFFAAQQVRRELTKNESAADVLQGVTALRYLTLEYVLRHEERAQAQWQLRNASLVGLLAGTRDFADTDDEAIVDDLRRSDEQVSKLFALLLANQQQPGLSNQENAVLAELESRLTGQIMNKAQSMISNALDLSEHSRQAVLAAQQHENIAVAAFGSIVVVAIGGIMLVMLRSLTYPLQKLQEGTAIVGAGNLDFSLGKFANDEFGELAHAFDAMTEKLKLTTVSRDELARTNTALEAEIGVRQQAELKTQAQLERLNLLHQITRSIAERQDLRSIFQVVIRSVEDQLPVDFCCICLYDELRQSLIVTSVGLRSAALALEFAMSEHASIPIDENGLSRCIRGNLVYEADISIVEFPFPQRLARGSLHALVMAPLIVESKVFGVLVTARHKANSFSSGECEFLRQLSEHVALAANQSQLYDALQSAYEDMRRTQQSAMQQERLRALGQMASGIAHDINNAISPVALYTESLLETEPGMSRRTRSYLEVIKRAIDDVAATVARMREFYRQREPQMTLTPVDVNLVLKQVVDLTRANWSDLPQKRGIVIKTQIESDKSLPTIMGVDGEIRDALTNLIFNAVDAMPDGGTLTLRARVADATHDARNNPGTRHMYIEVCDTGIGMDEDTRRRCLEPFFTTKGERGTGLGLAMVYGMVERHSASIEIDTVPNKGTTMRLVFALPSNTIEAMHPEVLPAMPVPLRILVVDDDPLVLKALRDTLEIDGHLVVAADGGQAGIDMFRKAVQGNTPFEVVITDLGMPYVDGSKVAAAIKEISRLTPVILLTGWGQRLVADGTPPPYVDTILSKPPRLNELRKALLACHSVSV